MSDNSGLPVFIYASIAYVIVSMFAKSGQYKLAVLAFLLATVVGINTHLFEDTYLSWLGLDNPD